MRRLRATSGLIAAAMLVSACGARMTEERRAIAIEGVGAGQGGAAAAPGVAQPDSTAEVAPGAAAGPTTDGTTTTDTPGVASGPGPSTQTQPGTGTGTTQPGQPPAEGGQTDGSAPQTTDTRAMPPGGNGGATDVGVTETSFVVANVSDISGPVPGLFQEAQIATKAAIEWFKATEGTIYGRTPALKPYDAKMDTGANRAAYQDACAATFAAVGSWSAFDQGATPVVKDCGGDNPYPDLRTVALTPGLQGLDNQVSADVMKPYNQPVSAQLYIKQTKPDVIDKGAYLYIAGEVTEYNSGMERWAAEQIGYVWEYVTPIEVSESNYGPFVLEMKSRGIEHVQFQGAYQQAVKLAKAMRDQGYWPESVLFQANVYTQDFLELGGADIEGVVVPLVSFPLEEIGASAEAQQYAEWYQRVAPGKSPTAMGMYSWGMTKLFLEAVKAAGPDLTRAKVLGFIRQQTGYTGNGLFPPQNYQTKVPNDCNLFTVVRDGQFAREFPAEGYFCEGGAYEVPPEAVD